MEIFGFRVVLLEYRLVVSSLSDCFAANSCQAQPHDCRVRGAVGASYVRTDSVITSMFA